MKKAIPRSEQPKNQQPSSGLSKSSSSNNDNNNSQIRTRKIFVGGLSASLTEEEFKNYFEHFGRITDVVVMHDSTTHKPRGFGFITFDSEDSVENVMQNSFHELNGRLVEVKKAVPKEDNSSNGSYYVRNGGGRGSSNNNYLPGNYPPYSPRYVVPPSYAPFPGYTGTGGFVYGPSVYDGWYPLGGFGGVSYGVAPVAPGFVPRMNGARACLLPYGSASFYPAYESGEGGVISFAAGGYNGVVRPGVNGKWNQVVLGIGHAPADVMPRKNEVDKRDVSLKGSNVAASNEQSRRGSDG